MNQTEITKLTYLAGRRLLGGHGLGAKWPFSFLRKTMKRGKVKVGTHLMYLDPMDSLRLSIKGVYEPLETELMTRFIHRGDHVLDVGANIGYYTLIMAKCVGSTGRVYAFEPDPRNFALLKRNVELNGYTNVILEQKAVSDKPGLLSLNLCDSNRGMTYVTRGSKEREEKQIAEVPAIVLDDYIKDTEITLAKIDVEGFEPSVITGMEKILRCRDIPLFLEFSNFQKEYGFDQSIFLARLELLGYQFTAIDENTKRVYPRISAKDLLEMAKNGGWKWSINLLCTK